MMNFFWRVSVFGESQWRDGAMRALPDDIRSMDMGRKAEQDERR